MSPKLPRWTLFLIAAIAIPSSTFRRAPEPAGSTPVAASFPAPQPAGAGAPPVAARQVSGAGLLPRPAAGATDDPARERVRAEAAAAAGRLDRWLAEWRRGTGTALDEGVELARVRRAALRELVPLDPQAALALAVPRGLRSELPAGIVAELETPIDASAGFEVLAVCFGSRDATLRFATIGDRRYQAFAYGRRLGTLSKTSLPVHGFAIDDLLAVAENPYRQLEAHEFGPGEEWAAGKVVAVGSEFRTFASAESLREWSDAVAIAEAAPGLESSVQPAMAAAIASSWVRGEKTVLILRAEFPDDPGSPATDQQVAEAVAAVNAYYADVSRGRTSFRATVFPGTLRTTATKAAVAEAPASGQRLISDDLLQQARAFDTSRGGTGEFNPDRHDRWIVIFKRVPQLTASITGGTVAWSGLAAIGGKSVWLNGTVNAGVLAHEIGHNQGLRHSHSWKPSSTSPIQPGTIDEYGDLFDVMGNSGSIPAGHFNTKQKSNIHYLDDAEVTVVDQPGVFRIHRSDHRSASGVQALRIPTGSGYDYWVEHRQEVPANARAAGTYLLDGVLLHWGSAPNFAQGAGTFLLDTTPTSSIGMTDAALTLSQVFVDPDYGINITPLTTGGSDAAEWIEVRVGFGATGNNRNPVMLAAAPPSAPLTARTDLTFTAEASDPDGDRLSYRWDFGDGQIKPATATVQHRWLKGGTYPVTVAAIDGRGGVASRSFKVEIADPLVSWTRRAADATSSWLYAVTYGGGRFVASGSSGTVLLSADGLDWSRINLGTGSVTLRALVYGAGRFVGTGSSYASSTATGAAYWSPDGLVWRAGTLPASSAELNGVAAGAGRFVAVGRSGKIYHSADGATWAETSSPATTELRAITFADGQFVAVGASGRVLTSPDGLNWTDRSLVTTALFTGVSRKAGTWYALGSFELWSSADAATWSRAVASPGVGTNGLFATQAGLLLAGTFDGKIVLAENHSRWESVTVDPDDPNATTYYGIAEGNGLYVAIGSRGALYTAGTPQLIAPRLTAPAQLMNVGAGRSNLIGFAAAGFSRLELMIDGQRVDATTDVSAGLRWTPQRFGSYELIVRGTTAGGSVVSSAPVLARATLGDWEWLNPSPIGNDLNAAVRANGRWWIAGDVGTLLSVDAVGQTTRIDVGTRADLKAITYANGRFVVAGWGYDYANAIGVSGIWSSTDGVNWTPWSESAFVYINHMIHADGQWVGVGESGRILTSRDGVTWISRVSGLSTTRLSGVAYGANAWIAVGDGGTILTSANGTTWSPRESGTTQPLNGATFAHGQFVVVGQAGEILTSPSGTTWTRRTSGISQTLRGVGVVSGQFVAVGDSGRVLVSADGGSWSAASLEGRSNFLRGVAADGNSGLLLGPAGEYYECIEPTAWMRRTRGRSDVIRRVIYADGRFVAVTEGFESPAARWQSPILVSIDGVDWTPWAAGASVNAQLYAVSHARDTWVAVGASGRIYTSVNATAWTQRTSGIGTALFATAGNPTGHIAAGANGRILGSSDGITWTSRESGVTSALRGATWGSRGYVVVGDGGVILASADGTTWAAQSSGTTQNLQDVIWAEGLGYVAGGNNGTVLTSTDAATWVARTTNSTDHIQVLAHTALGIVAGGGTSGVMLFSGDAVNWTRGPVPVERVIRAIAASPTSAVAGGDSGALLAASLRNAAPTIAVQPQSKAVATGDAVLLTVQPRDGTGASYQWFRDGVPLPGATRASYAIGTATGALAGDYTVRIATGAGAVVSSPAALWVAALDAAPGHLINLSILTSLTSASDSFTVGMVIGGAGAGGVKPLLVRAAGPALSALGVPGVLEDPRLEFFTGTTRAAENDNWDGLESIRAAAAQVGAFPFSAATSRDAAISFSNAAIGAHSARVTGTGPGLVIAEVYDATAPGAFTRGTARLINVSVLKHIGGGVTAGFVIGGSTSRMVLVRAVGPTLGAPPFGVPGVVSDPQLSLYSGQTRLSTNDDWAGTAVLASAFSRVGAFALPSDSRDAALLMELPPGSYTVQVTGGSGTGVALVEIYEVP